jgi:glycosyltransferase involved in cell wall biosynthesis
VIGSIDERGGGTTSHVLSVSRLWAKLGHECHLLCLDPPDSSTVANAPPKTIALGARRNRFAFWQRFLFSRYGYTPALGNWLKVNAKNYDAIILNGLWNYTSFGTWRALRKTNVPYYVCPHGMLDPWLRQASPLRHALRLVFWGLIERKVVRDSKGIFFSAEEERQFANEAFLRGRYGDGYVLGYGAEDITGESDRQKAAFLAVLPQLRARKYLLFLGRIHPKKGLDLLVNAFGRLAAEFPEVDLVIAGPDDVELTPRLQRLITDPEVERRIHWVGMLSGDRKWGAFRLAEYFVLPSHQENFGIAVVEAMAASVPVLVSKKVNIWREVEASGGGLATTDTIEGTIQALRLLLKLTPPQRDAMGARARVGYMEQFNLEKNAGELIDLIARINNNQVDLAGVARGNHALTETDRERNRVRKL